MRIGIINGKKTIQQYSDVCEELVEVNKDYKKNRER